jgi:RHS repeat-associated protein
VQGAPPDGKSADGAKSFDPATSRITSRDARTNTFVNRDGSHTLQASVESLNFKDAKGVWAPIDNKVVVDPDRAGGLTNAGNGWRVHFGTSSQGISVDTAEGSIGFVPVGAAVGVAPVLDKSGTGVTYPEVWPGADLHYEVTADAVLETVLIKSASAAGPFLFTTVSGSKVAVLGGVAPVASLSAKDGGLALAGALGSAVAFQRPEVLTTDGAPVDSAGAKLAAVGGQVSLSVDPVWLAKQPASAFPVRLDPSIGVGPTDGWSYKSTGYSCQLCGLRVGNSRDSGDTNYRSVITYPLPGVAGSTVYDAVVGTLQVAGTANYNYTGVYMPNAWSFAGAIGGGGQIAIGLTGPGNGTLDGDGLTSFIQTHADQGWPSVNLGFAGNETAGYYSFQQHNSALYVTYDHPPTAAARAGALPGDGAVVASTMPTLSVPAASDPDGDVVEYNFSITGAGDRNGRASSGWIASTSWVVPAGILQDGQSYSWSVATRDQGFGMQTPAAWTNGLRVNQRLGSSQVTPFDSLAGVGVNLANGNANLAFGGHSVASLGGALGVGFSYNAQQAANRGLLGQYYADYDRQWNFATAGSPSLVRIDPDFHLNWGGPGEPVSPTGLPAGQYLVKWTGYVTADVTGDYQLGTEADDGAKIFLNGAQVASNWPGSPGMTWSSTVHLVGGTAVPIEVHYNNQMGRGMMWLRVQTASGTTRADGSTLANDVVPSSWLSPGVSTLPSGWTMSLPGAAADYARATVVPGSVVLTDTSGSSHTYTDNGRGGFAPPPGEDGVLALTTGTGGAGGTVTLTESDGTVYTFDPQGNPTAVTSATDSLHPAAAVYGYDTSVTPARVSTVTDPVSGRVINLYYGSNASCPTPPAGYDSAAPPTMLCRAAYWDGTTTDVHYKNGLLGAVVEPGNEVTQFGYAEGLLTQVKSPMAVDWQGSAFASGTTDDLVSTKIAYTWVQPASGGTLGNVRPAFTAATAPYPTGSIPFVTAVTAPSPDGQAATPRPSRTYSYPGTNETKVKITGASTATADLSVTYDSTGRTLVSTAATGLASSTAWDAEGRDLPISSTDQTGRKSTTIYDWAMRATDTYGPAPASCFQASGLPVASPPVTCGVIGHTRTGFDTDTAGTKLVGLQAAAWPNTLQSGAPSARLTAAPRSAGWTAAQQAKLSAIGSSSQYTGELALDPGTTSKTYSFTGTVGDVVNDGLRVYVDGVPVIDRWNTLRQAVLTDQAKGFWRLSDAAGATSAANQVGGGSAGVPTAVTFGGAAAGPVDPATSAVFNGSTSQVTLPNAAVPTGLGAVTVEAWVKPSGYAWQDIVTKYQPVGPDLPDQYDLRLTNTGQVQFLQGTGGGAYATVTSNAVAPAGAWTHLVATSTGGVGKIYVNGALDSTSPAGTFPTATPTATNDVQIGRRSDGWGPFNGSIADVALYDAALTPGQVATHHAGGTATLTSTALQPGGVTFTQPPAGTTNPVSTPHTVRVDYRNPVAAASLSLSATPSGGGAAVIGDGSFAPRYGLASRSTTDDAGGIAGGAQTTALGYSGSGLDPAYGLVTDSIVDPGGLSLNTTTAYETPGPTGFLRRTARALPSGSTGTPSQAITTTYYGNAETRVNPCGGATAVNQGGMPKVTTSQTPATGSAVATEVVYDNVGRVVASRIVADGANWTCTTFDVRGRATQVVIPAVIGGTSRTVTSNYAVSGNPLVTSVTDPAGTITTTVDLLGRATVYKDVFGTTTTTSYDQAGRVFKTVAVSAVNGSGVSSSQTQVQTFDAFGRPDALYLDPTSPASPDAAHKVAQVAYSASTGEVTGVSYPANGTSASFTYDPAGRQTVLGYAFPAAGSTAAGTVTDTVSFSQAGTIMTDTVTQTGQAGTFDNLAASSYGYDAAHRLVSATAGPSDNRHVYAYTYGAAAACTLPGALSNAAAGSDTNRTMLSDAKNGGAAAVTCYAYDKADRLTGTYPVVGGVAGAVNTYSYDAHGNDTNLKLPGAANGQALTYDSANRHIKTAADGTTSGVGNTSATYTRDATDRIIKRVGSSNITGVGLESPATTEFYGFSGAGDTPDFTYATSGSGKTVVERMIPLPGGVTLTVSGNAAYAAGASGSTAVWGYGNLHGDNLLTTDKTGARAGVISLYEPFGTPLPTGSAGSSTAAVLPNTNLGSYDAGWLGAGGKQRFTEHAGTINTVEMGARQYSPQLGRFLQVDPIEGGSANDYDYVMGDPVNGYDLDGNRLHLGYHFRKKHGHLYHRESSPIHVTRAQGRAAFKAAGSYVVNHPGQVAGTAAWGVCIFASAGTCGLAAGAAAAASVAGRARTLSASPKGPADYSDFVGGSIVDALVSRLPGGRGKDAVNQFGFYYSWMS